VTLSATASTAAGGGLPAYGPGSTFTLSLNAGDVVQVLSAGGDLSGSLIKADAPIQVITGAPCADVPSDALACDHLEQINLPVETLGKKYVVTVPTGPDGVPVGHVVHLYGNFNGTHLQYEPAMDSAPATLNAGQVVNLGVVTNDFAVKADQPFAVETFMIGGSLAQPNVQFTMRQSDPSQSLAVAVEQYRSHYVFLAPHDYEESYVDVAAPANTQVMLDQQTVAAPATSVGNSGFEIRRIPLSNKDSGSHVLTADSPVGIQVIGYGLYTSYQYPGGLTLQAIAPVPVL
jgi:hypothetical protein